jgi:hypothetical protein
LLTKWLLDFGYLDLNLDFANMLTTMVIGFWIFEFEFGFSRYVNHNGYGFWIFGFCKYVNDNDYWIWS